MSGTNSEPMILWAILVLGVFTQAAGQTPENERHVFYLHGMIVELQGKNAVSETFGAYKYEDIVDSLEAYGYVVHSEVRPRNTDYQEYARRISAEIDQLISRKVAPSDITVIGASAGAHIAMAVSSLNGHPVNYVLLGANSDRLEAERDWKLHGRILGIYEASDRIAGKDYTYWMEQSPDALVFDQLKINTGLGHGFLYRPIPDWLAPARRWISGNVPDD
ncbi:alpha/beta hydrolase [Robiginitalea sp. SC105]|uniref:alpha/beta hydrolase n=1 Tax=Robiginitalea sp. SC105 TaxID=2762332 RepID=UPI00163B0601|nr:alpha/beta hydrolase [Robiginitalea sp. SC105]MBC2840447.1 alpha/beta hydrolase [Robiginitalea sp. SC105]